MLGKLPFITLQCNIIIIFIYSCDCVIYEGLKMREIKKFSRAFLKNFCVGSLSFPTSYAMEKHILEELYGENC